MEDGSRTTASRIRMSVAPEMRLKFPSKVPPYRATPARRSGSTAGYKRSHGSAIGNDSIH